MIQEDYVSFETAKLLKDKGFEILTDKVYDNQNKLDSQIVVCWQEKRLPYISAPTLQMAMKWLRETHKIYIMIDRSFSVEDSWHYCICVDDDFDNLIQQEVLSHRKYEEACEDGIKYCLENLIEM